MRSIGLHKGYQLLTGGRKRRFGATGIMNVMATNITLQLLLYSGLSVGTSTLVSQITNAILGYLLYSNFAFQDVSFKRKRSSFRYAVMFLVLWSSNWAGIQAMASFGISRNIAAILMILPLACLSYLTQKKWIFTDQ